MLVVYVEYEFYSYEFLLGMIDYNFLLLRQAVDDVFEVRMKSLQSKSGALEAPKPSSSLANP